MQSPQSNTWESLPGALTAPLQPLSQLVQGAWERSTHSWTVTPCLPMANRSPVSGTGPRPLPTLFRHQARPPGSACGTSSQTNLCPACAHKAPAQLLCTGLGKPRTSCLLACLLAFFPLPMPNACHSTWDTPHDSDSRPVHSECPSISPAIVPMIG